MEQGGWVPSRFPWYSAGRASLSRRQTSRRPPGDGLKAASPVTGSPRYSPGLIEDVERLLTPAEAAPVLLVTPKKMAEWRRTGEGPPFVRISHKVVGYRHSSLMAWAVEREARSTHELRHRTNAPNRTS